MGFLSGIDDVYKKYSPAWLGNKNNVWGKMLGTAESDAPQQADPNALTPEQIAAQQRQSRISSSRVNGWRCAIRGLPRRRREIQDQ